MPQPHYTPESFEAINSLGYLIKRCGALMGLVAEAAFEAQPLSFTQWIVLMKLRGHSSHMSATELSEEMGHDMGALTRVVDSLEGAGFVKRERSRHDRRAVEIALTPAGRRQVESSIQVVVDLLNELLEPFSRSEFTALISQLQRLLLRLQDFTARLPELRASSASPGVATATRKARPRKTSATPRQPGGKATRGKT